MKGAALFLMCCLFLSGNAMAGAAQSRNISGKVFIVTGMNSLENLAPAEITVMAEGNPEVTQYFKAKYRHTKAQQEEHATTLAARQWGLYDSLVGGAASGDAAAVAKKKYKEAFDTLKWWTGPAYYFQELPAHLADASTKTSPDGKFALAVPPGKYIIAATASRFGGEPQSYYWLLKVDATAEDQSLFLNNDNLFETNCDVCFQPAKAGER